jgi:cell division control protein CDC15
MREQLNTMGFQSAPSFRGVEEGISREIYLPMQANPRKRCTRFSRPSIDVDRVRRDSLSYLDPLKAFQRQTLLEQFEGLVKLGEGSCAVVYRAIDRREQQQVALKVTRTDDEEHLRNVQDEYDLLKLIDHPNIIKAKGFFTYIRGAVLVEEFYDGENLEQIVAKCSEGCIPEASSLHLFIQLLDAVAYLHKEGIIHRDIKAQNILISSSKTDLRLVDFNTSKHLSDGVALTMTGTRQYMPPEVLKGKSPSEGSDVWASGLCFHYMLIGDLPSKRGTHVQLEGSRWQNVSYPCKVMVQKCLEPCEDLRASANEILS